MYNQMYCQKFLLGINNMTDLIKSEFKKKLAGADN